MDCLAEISKTINRHRTEVFITCEESCWCWGVEAAILGYSESAKEHSVEAETKYRCFFVLLRLRQLKKDKLAQYVADVPLNYIVIRIKMEDFVQNKYGYCFYEVRNNSALIYNLYVHQKFRLQGRSKILLKHAIAEIRDTGYMGKIKIEVAPRGMAINRKKIASFYERMGLAVV